MTRKRKVQNVDSNEQSKSEDAGFGRHNKNHEQAPKGRDFKKPRNEAPQEDEDGRFPTELIRYLKQMSKEEPEKDMVEVFMEKCVEEVNGREELLLQFTEGCYAVEQIFLRSQTGAYQFLERLNHTKKVQRLALIQNAASERTIEKLMYKLVPLDDAKYIELLSVWIELIIDNWQTLIFDRSGSFFIRTLGRVLIGLGEEHLKFKSTFEAIQAAEIKQKRVSAPARAELQKLLARVFDFVSMKDFLNFSSTALIFQNFAAFDQFLKAKNGSEFVRKFIREGRVADSWRQANSSRVWDSLIELITDEELQLELFNTIKPDLVQLATHEYARFPLESLFKRSTSSEIAQEVADQLLPLFPNFLQQQSIPPIVGHTLDLLSKHEDLQTHTMKLLRTQFGAAGSENQKQFFPNLLTLNDAVLSGSAEELEFEVENSKLFGSLIIDKLFQFAKKKALMTSFVALSAKTLNEMAVHKIASHIFDSFARSLTIDLDVKKELFGRLDCGEMIKNAYGSRVFESFWFELEWTEDEREHLVNDLFLPLLSSTDRNKFVGILLAKLHVNEFRENRRQWRSQLTKWIGEEQKRRQTRQQFVNRTRPHDTGSGGGDKTGGNHAGNHGGRKPNKKRGNNKWKGGQKGGEQES